ncbi:hypothetical protein [Brevundimonas sp.]|uniref:hypothetical protein n=1 Tax=Brevundimonas sp. TaxID=1871086 RepID=UPI001D5E498F|nr:hypothetical protein [Brevundimonas sp.]MBL0948309.1 hypothetical protein [Brevundimonas sp.]
MFEFGRDLRRLFDGPQADQDLGWLEVVDVDVLRGEARRQTIDAGRATCPRPVQAWLLASALWREHTRRSGAADSLQHARLTALDARKAARTNDERAEAVMALAETMVLSFDLYGGPESLGRALSLTDGLKDHATRPALKARLTALHARIKARQARLSEGDSLEAMAFLDQAVHELSRRPGPLLDALKLDRAALTLMFGIQQRDARLLDQAGRELRDLVETCPSDRRPLTRARALALCGAGLSALATLADNDEAVEQGRALFDAACDQFTADHSPMDWAAVTLARSAALPGAACLTGDGGPSAIPAALIKSRTVLGLALADTVVEAGVMQAETQGDLLALDRLAARLRSRLAMDAPRPLAWSVDQIGLARIALARARLLDKPAGPVRLVLIEAASAAREEGADLIADRADHLLRQVRD